MRRYGQAVSYPASAPSELPRGEPRNKIQLQGTLARCLGAGAGLGDRHEQPLKSFGKASEVPRSVLPTHSPPFFPQCWKPNPAKCESRAMRGRYMPRGMRRRAEGGPYTTKNRTKRFLGEMRSNHEPTTCITLYFHGRT